MSMPENDPAYVDELLKLAGLSADDALRADSSRSRDITTLSLKTLETYAATPATTYVKALIADGEAREWIAGRQLIDLIEHFPLALDAEQLRAMTRPLAPRAYSIASSRKRIRRRGASAGLRRALREPSAAPARASPRISSPSG